MVREIEESITGVIIAGGRGRRMGGEDKGLQLLNGRPLVEHVLQALEPQTDSIIISANRNLDKYSGYGYPVVTDQSNDFQGPLAGIVSAMIAVETPWLVVAPCDAPALPTDLVERLGKARKDKGVLAAVVHDGERLQPLAALFSKALAGDLKKYLSGGGRSAMSWIKSLSVVQVDFADKAKGFVNLNTQADLAQYENHSI